MAELNINNSVNTVEVEAIDCAHKHKIDHIVINFNTLTEREQVGLFLNLFNFAHKELPDNKNLNIFIVEKK